MKIKINKNSIYIFLFFTIFLDAYRFLAIGNRDITLWYIGAFLLFFVSLFNISDVINGLKHNIWSIIMVIYMIVNYIIMGSEAINSLAIGLLCWIFYIFSYRKSSITYFQRAVCFFQKGMNICAVYGIYQVIAFMLELPLRSLWIDGYMVDGYNWGNNINIAGVVIRRANAIFREPSFFAQFLAINILIYFQEIINRKESKRKLDSKYIRKIFLNGVALVLAFSGTGIIMATVGMALLLIFNNTRETKKFISRHKLLIMTAIVVVFALLLIPNPLVSYLLSRTSEFDSTNTKSISGYLRMVLPYQAAFEIVTQHNALMGVGIGNALLYVLENGFQVGNSMNPILVRTIAEEGLIGLFILLRFTIKIWNKKNIRINSYKAILIGTYLMSPMHGTWSSEVFWLLLGFLNVKITDFDEVKDMKSIREKISMKN